MKTRLSSFFFNYILLFTSRLCSTYTAFQSDKDEKTLPVEVQNRKKASKLNTVTLMVEVNY
ncbi:hypothetical protein HZS_4844 [Henneguya salminicola]|nr:hypothetical protein HZS_4844 [Henneguya salminicola]